MPTSPPAAPSDAVRRFLDGRGFWLILAVAAVLLFTGNDTPYWDQDEAAYAGFARTMVSSGDWVVPQFPWSWMHRKPPLQFWAMALSFRAFGESEWAARLPGALFMVLTWLLVAWLGARLFGRTAARGAALVLATSLYLPVLGHVALTDSLLLLCETAAVLSLYAALQQPAFRWTALFWVAVSLGMLTKGPPVLILTGGLVLFLLFTHPGRRRLVSLHPWIGLPLALLPLLAWGYLAWQRTDGELVRFLVDWYILRRGSGSVLGQVGPPGYYLLTILAGLLPWSLLLPGGLQRLVAGVREREERALFVAGWLISGWLLYEIVPSKLPSYVLGAYAALALLIADEALARCAEPVAERTRLRRWGMGAVLVVAVLAAAALAGGGATLLRGFAGPAAVLAAAVLLATLFPAAARLKRGRPEAALRWLCGGAVLFLFSVWGLLFPTFKSQHAFTRRIAQQAARLGGPDAAVILARNFKLPSLPLYLERRHARYRQAENDADLRVLYAASQPVVLVLDRNTARRLPDLVPAGVAVRIQGLRTDGFQKALFWVVPNLAAQASFARSTRR